MKPAVRGYLLKVKASTISAYMCYSSTKDKNACVYCFATATVQNVR